MHTVPAPTYRTRYDFALRDVEALVRSKKCSFVFGDKIRLLVQKWYSLRAQCLLKPEPCDLTFFSENENLFFRPFLTAGTRHQLTTRGASEVRAE